MSWEKSPINSSRLTYTFTRRSMFVGGVQAALGLVLAGRMAYIAVAENERYQLLSESNRVNLSLIPPRRGWFVDRHGEPLANNRADFRVDVIPAQMRDRETTVARLANLLALDDEEIARIEKDLDQASGYTPVRIASGLEWDEFAAVSVRLPDLPGVSPRQGYTRYYPGGAAVGHLLGYVGTVSAEEYEREKDPLLITPGFKIGKDGLEKMFEDKLQGKPGAKRVEVTARGKIVRELATRPDVPGKPIKLTIDAGLQEYAARRIGKESGSVAVIDCHSGDILALASMPSFDPNSFSDGISQSEWKMLSDDDHVPLRNKTLRGLYPPGSTVKPMVALALLEQGIDPNERVTCSGAFRVGNRNFHCWQRRGHGSVDMAKGVYQSCDIYFYKMALEIGMDPIAAMARKLGLGAKYDLPVLSQSYGTVPDPDWKKRKYKQDWQRYDTVNATIGQGYMLVNPLQLAVMAARIASGKRLQPHLMFEKDRPPAPSLGIPEEHIAIVREAMHQVTTPGVGTAGRARIPVDGVTIAGKTGTAQVVGLSHGRGGLNVPWKYRDHGLFVAFTPAENPRYAASVVIEHGAGSSAAYPVARDVLTWLYDRDKAMEALLPLEEQWGGTIEQRMAADMAAFKARQQGIASDDGNGGGGNAGAGG